MTVGKEPLNSARTKKQLLERLLPRKRLDPRQNQVYLNTWRRHVQQVRFSSSRQQAYSARLMQSLEAPSTKRHWRKQKGGEVSPFLARKPSHDNPLSIMPPSAQLDVTRGPGQHLRKSLAKTATSVLHQYNNLRYFYTFTPLLPSLHPLRRLVGMYTRRGNAAKSTLLAECTYAKLKTSGPFLRSAVPAGYLHALNRIETLKNPFTLKTFKIAANKVKVPYLSSYSRAFSATFSLLAEYSVLKENIVRKTFTQRGFKVSNAFGKARCAANLLDGSDLNLSKKRQELMHEANLNKPHLRFKKA